MGDTLGPSEMEIAPNEGQELRRGHFEANLATILKDALWAKRFFDPNMSNEALTGYLASTQSKEPPQWKGPVTKDFFDVTSEGKKIKRTIKIYKDESGQSWVTMESRD